MHTSIAGEKYSLVGVQTGMRVQVGPPLLHRRISQNSSGHSPRASQGQEFSDVHLRPDLILGHTATETYVTTRELVSQECLHTCVHRENWSPRSTDKQACRTNNPQSETARPANTRDYQMAKSKCKDITSGNHGDGDMTVSKPRFPIIASLRYPNTPEKQ